MRLARTWIAKGVTVAALAVALGGLGVVPGLELKVEPTTAVPDNGRVSQHIWVA